MNGMLRGLNQAANAANLGKVIHWNKLTGGRTNHVYLGQFSNFQAVFKFFDKTRSNPLFPNDIYGEEAALISLANTNLCPPFLGRFETDTGPCLVYEFVTGVIPSKVTRQTMAALAQLHTQPPPVNCRKISGSPDAILAQGRAFLEQDKSDRAKSLCANIPNIPTVDHIFARFLHGDPTPANTVITDGGVTFVDWQCPATGDPVHDLSIALSGAMHSIYGGTTLEPNDVTDLLVAYGDNEIVERYRTLEPIYRWRMACYCQWKVQQGETEYAAAGLAEFS